MQINTNQCKTMQIKYNHSNQCITMKVNKIQCTSNDFLLIAIISNDIIFIII